MTFFMNVRAVLVFALLCLFSFGTAATARASAPIVALSPTSVNFGSVAVGSTSTVHYVTVTNTGNAALDLSRNFGLTADFAFAGLGNCPDSLAAGSSCKISVSFTPKASGMRTGTLSIPDNAANSPQTVPLTGTGGTGVSVAISPATATIQVGLTQLFTATVSGSTNTAVTWSVNGTSGGNSTVGTISGSGLYTAPASVPTGGSVKIMAVSSADTTKSASSTVTIAAAPATVAVSISPTSSSLQCGSTQQFAASVTGTTNNAVTWSVNGIAGGNSTVGTISTSGLYQAPATPPAGSTATVTATSAYDTTKSARATVTIAASSAPIVSLSPTPLNFGNVTVGTTSTVRYLTITNTGNAALDLSGNFGITGDFAFGGVGNCPDSLVAGASCNVSVQFTPTVAGTRTGTLTLNDNAANSPQTIALTGTGVAAGTSSFVGYNQYWISTTGSDSNAGTQSAPWATFAHADAALQLGTNGAVVHVSPGTYNQCIVTTKSGTATARIKYLSDTQFGAHLICTAAKVPAGQSTAATIWNGQGAYVDYIGFDIDGQNVQGQSRIGLYLNSNGYDRVLGNKIHGLEGCSSSASPTATTEVAGYTPHNVYDGNIMYSIGNTCQMQGFASGVAGQGIYVSNPYDVITNNIFYNIGYWTSTNGTAPGFAIWMNHCGVGHETVANNTMFGNGAGVIYSWQSGSGPSCQSGPNYMTIANNIIVDNQVWGILEDDYDCRVSGSCSATNYGPNNFVENNLVYGNMGSPSLISVGNAGICPKVGDSSYNVVITHSHCATNSVANINPASGTLFANWQLNGSGDYHLKAGSPAIDTGENTGSNSFAAPTTDYFGAARPVGATVDIGYQEYGSAPAGYPTWWLQ